MSIAISFRKLLIMVLLALLLLMGLFGLLMKTNTQPSQHTLHGPAAIVCPGPPFSCW